MWRRGGLVHLAGNHLYAFSWPLRRVWCALYGHETWFWGCQNSGGFWEHWCGQYEVFCPHERRYRCLRCNATKGYSKVR